MRCSFRVSEAVRMNGWMRATMWVPWCLRLNLRVWRFEASGRLVSDWGVKT